MGAWGVQPMQNDSAYNWIGSRVRPRLAEVVEATLRAYLDGADENIEEEEAETAVAMLVDCTNDSQMKYKTVDIRFEAKSEGLWDLAIQVVDKMIEEDWASSWKDPDKKRQVLNELKSELVKIKEENKAFTV